MTTSTNAIFAFGFDLGEELPESLQIAMEQKGFDGWDEFLIDDSDMLRVMRSQCADYPEYYERLNDQINKLGVEIIEHCSREYKMYFLAVRGTKQVAHRGHPQVIKQEPLCTWKLEAFKAFCERHDIEWQEPAWHIFSMWN